MPLTADPTITAPGTELVLDPSEVITGRGELALNTGAIRVGPDGPDWGDAAIQAYLAEARRGDLPVDFRLPNRQIRIPLLLGADGPVNYDTARRNLQAKVGLIQREGGALRRGTDPALYADIVNATLTLPDKLGWLGVEADVVLTLEALPDFYGAEVELSDHSEAVLPELVFTETNIAGDYPGRLRLQVDNDGTVDWLGLTAAVRSRHYSAEDTARLVYEAEDLTPLDTSAVALLDGSSGGSAVHHTELANVWTPILALRLDDGSYLTHEGSYRVEARIVVSSDVDAVRVVWGVGDLTNSVENDPATGFTANGFYDVILGDIRLDPPPVGTHRWDATIQAKASPDAAGTAEIYIDRVTLIPLDEGWAEISAPRTGTGTFTGFVARDEMEADTSIGDPLDGRTAPLGGDWATSGATTDFELAYEPVEISHLFRDTTGEIAARFAVLGTADYGTVDLSGDILWEGDGHSRLGLLARYVDASSYLFGILALTSETSGLLSLTPVVAGDGLQAVVSEVVTVAPDTLYTLRLRAADGVATLSMYAGEALVTSLSVASDDLAVGGTLEEGNVGLYDQGTTGTVTRRYSSLYVSEPTLDAAVFAGRTCQLGTDGNWRQDPAGEAYGPVADEGGDLLRIPPSGIEPRTVEFIVKPDRGGFETLPTSAIDPVTARAFYRPSHLFP